MKAKYLPLLLTGCALVITGCNSIATTGEGSSQNVTTSADVTTSEPSSTTTTPTVTKYKVMVSSCPSGIKYTLDKTEAEKNEEVTFTITEIAAGLTLTNVKMNGTVLTGTDNVYKFNMPFGGASIVVNYTVSGDMTIRGDGFALALEEDATTGIFSGECDVTSTKASVGFDVFLGETKLDYYPIYDYTKSYGNIEWGYSTDYGFGLASGCSYKFTYNPNAQIPFSVVRTSVNVLPTDAKSLYSLFDGDAGAQTQNTCNPLNTQAFTYSCTDNSDVENPVNVTYDYKRYANESYAVIEDILNDDSYVTYKKIDNENKVFSTVDTYPVSFGNNDKSRYDGASSDAFSAQFDISENDPLRDNKWYDEYTYEKSARIVNRNLNWSAHSGNALEWEFAYAYRISSTDAVINAASYTKYDVVSTPLDNGSFKVELDSIVENNRAAQNSDVEQHNGEVYDVEFVFNKNGSIQSMDYKFTNYPQSKWDFSTHTNTQKAAVTKKMKFNATYGDPLAGTSGFDSTPYFINQINQVTFNNPDVGEGNTVAYGDYVAMRVYGGTAGTNLKAFDYLPKTALDSWQYEVTGDSEGYLDFTYGEAVAAEAGSTTMYVTNQTDNSGFSYSGTLTIGYAKSVIQFYLTSGSHATNIYAYSGETKTCTVAASVKSGYNSSIAPVIYDVTVAVKVDVVDPISGDTTQKYEVSDKIEILRHDKILKFKVADDITEATTFYFFLNSELYADPTRKTTFQVFVTPNTYEKAELKNTTWRTCSGYFVDNGGNPLLDYIQVDFAETTGTITNAFYNISGVLQVTDTYNFTYSVDDIGRIDATITTYNVESYTLSTYISWELLFEIQDGKLGLAMLCESSATWTEDETAYSIFGDWTATYYDDEPTEYTCTAMETLEKVTE